MIYWLDSNLKTQTSLTFGFCPGLSLPKVAFQSRLLILYCLCLCLKKWPLSIRFFKPTLGMCFMFPCFVLKFNETVRSMYIILITHSLDLRTFTHTLAFHTRQNFVIWIFLCFWTIFTTFNKDKYWIIWQVSLLFLNTQILIPRYLYK